GDGSGGGRVFANESLSVAVFIGTDRAQNLPVDTIQRAPVDIGKNAAAEKPNNREVQDDFPTLEDRIGRARDISADVTELVAGILARLGA
ncbi:hypothetical protein V5O48_018749, partial [Marasmius crinis-equi]